MICPIIDVISDDTFEYITGSDMTWGGFNWKMNFRWYSVPQRELDRRNGDRSLPLRYVSCQQLNIIIIMMMIYTVSQKKAGHLMFYHNLGNCNMATVHCG